MARVSFPTERDDGDPRTRDERILYALARGGKMRTDDLAAAARLPRQTAYDGLSTCHRLGYVWRPARSLWALTIRGQEIADGIAPPPSEGARPARLR